MGDAVAALSLGIALEKLTDLEEQHDEDSLGKLCLGPWQETDAERSDGGHGHQKVLVEGIAVGNSFCCLLQCVVPDEQIGNKIDQQQLPCGQLAVLFDDDGGDEEHDGDGNQCQFASPRFVFMVVMLVVVVTVTMAAVFVVFVLVMLMLTTLVFMMFMQMRVFAALVLIVFVMMMCHNRYLLNNIYRRAANRSSSLFSGAKVGQNSCNPVANATE